MRHKHADLMIAKAEDSSLEIQFKNGVSNHFETVDNPAWNPDYEYRIKPRKKTVYQWAYKTSGMSIWACSDYFPCEPMWIKRSDITYHRLDFTAKEVEE